MTAAVRTGHTNRGGLVFAGLLTLDLAQVTKTLPAAGRKGTANASYIDVGGPAANAAVTAGILGAEVSLLTVSGSGLLPGYVRSVLDGFGVAVDDQAPTAQPPVASVWIATESGERTILSTDTQAMDVVPRSGRLLPPGTGAVLIDGHYAEVALAVAAEATESGIPIVLDCGRWRPVFADLLPVASDIIMAAAFRPPEFGAVSGQDLVAAVYERWQPQLCAMTRGADEIVVVDAGGLRQLPVREIDAVDTTGAGDVLHGAYMYYRYVESGDGGAALAHAAEIATKSCEFLGARRGVEALRPDRSHRR